MIVLGIVLIVARVPAAQPRPDLRLRASSVVIGVILLVVGVILAILGSTGRAVGGRRHYY